SWSLISFGIDRGLEGGETNPPVSVHEALAALTFLEEGVDQGVDGRRNLVVTQRGAQHVAQRRVLRARAAQGELIVFLTLLIDAQDADVAHVVVAAGVDAAGDLDLQLADL